jgi:lipoprotein-anchoring transpeptidase ErfK/SrfK
MVLRIITGFIGLALLLISFAAILSPGFRSDVAHVAGDLADSLGGIGQSSSPWNEAIQTADGSYIGVVTGNAVNVRAEPTLEAPAVDSLFEKHLVQIHNTVTGDDVDGETDWYQIGDGQYATAALIEPFEPRTPDETYQGHWVDINLTDHYAVAWDGDTPVYAAILMTGRAGWDTPEGEFEIIRRVESETMDAATIGIPEDAPTYYYLEDVPHVQYFAESGYAIHGNDWSPPEAFGDTGSHGCINMQVKDAEFFWDFLEEGSSLIITY